MHGARRRMLHPCRYGTQAGRRKGTRLPEIAFGDFSEDGIVRLRDALGPK